MDALFTLKDLKNLYNLAKNRNQSLEDYFEFQKFQGELLYRFLYRYKAITPGDTVLDLGCAYGGYSSAFRIEGAHVVGLDLSPMINPDGVPMLKGDATQTPVAPSVFDLVICASLIEHVPEPEVLIQECLRVLKPGGYLYLSFPPYYSPNGGHQFAPYHLFGQRFAIRVATRRGLYQKTSWQEERFVSTPGNFSDAFGKWGLYKLTISKVQKLLRSKPVVLVKRATRYLPIDISGIPVFGEFFTWHVQFLLKKK